MDFFFYFVLQCILGQYSKSPKKVWSNLYSFSITNASVHMQGKYVIFSQKVYSCLNWIKDLSMVLFGATVENGRVALYSGLKSIWLKPIFFAVGCSVRASSVCTTSIFRCNSKTQLLGFSFILYWSVFIGQHCGVQNKCKAMFIPFYNNCQCTRNANNHPPKCLHKS